MSSYIVHIIEALLYIIIIGMTAYLFCLSVYSIFLSLFGFAKFKKDYPNVDPEARFLILIAAHNEEIVIGATLENLKNIKYDSSLYKIVVVNDNSTDRTGDICDQYGIEHVDTIKGEFQREGVGKPAGIQYALRKLGFEKVKNDYDLIMILDADNFVDANILAELNSQWLAKDKPEAIQTYLDCKNSNSILSFGYCTSYWTTNRFFQLSKYRLGLPIAIGGTGFVVRSDFLINLGGFCFKSLTEDLELEIEIVKRQGRVLWNHNTRIYDEKPDNLKTSLKQRYRWSKGHWYVAFTNLFSLLKLIFTQFKWRFVDQLFYLFSMGRALQVLIILVNIFVLTLLRIYDQSNADGGFSAIITDSFFISKFAISTDLTSFISSGDWISLITHLNIFVLISIFYGMFLLPLYAARVDKGIMLNPFKLFFCSLYYGLSFMLVQFLAFFRWRKQNTWIATPHNKVQEEHK